jgi:hypothetical protein
VGSVTQLSFGTICNNRKHKLQFDGIGDELVELHASAVGETQQGIFDTAADLATLLTYFTNNKSSTTPFEVDSRSRMGRFYIYARASGRGREACSGRGPDAGGSRTAIRHSERNAS